MLGFVICATSSAAFFVGGDGLPCREHVARGEALDKD